MKAILRSGFLALAIMAPALPADAGPLELKRVIAEARRDCASAVAGGEITFSEDLVSNVDITGDGKFEQIINFSRFDCSSAIIYWSTGGSPLAIIVGEKIFKFPAVRGWKVIDWGEQPILLFNLHQTHCRLTGTPERSPGGESDCIRAYAWSDVWGEFVTADCAFRAEDRCWRMDRHKY